MAPALWGTFFIGCHLWQITTLLREQQPIVLNPDQELAYEKAFCSYGFTPRQFLDILESACGVWRTYADGDWIQREGDEMDKLHCVLEGEAMLVRNGCDAIAMRPGKGGWLGEFHDPNQPADYWEHKHPAIVSWRCASERCRTLALSRRALHQTLSTNPRLAAAANRAEIADLWGKLHSAGPQHRVKAYRSMLEVALSDGQVTASERRLLETFRERHAIADKDHEEGLRAAGWSVDEYARGRRSRLLMWGRSSPSA